MSESLGPDTQDRIPRAALRVAVDVQCAASTSGRQHDPAYRAMVEKREKASLEAAYPLIRERVCQELAEALRQKGRFSSRAEEASALPFAAEFVERFGKADR